LASVDRSSITASSDDSYPHLFSPMRLGHQRLRNRIAFASMFSGRPRNGDVTPELITFYANRAAGGAALVVTEPLSVLRNVDLFGRRLSDSTTRPSWRSFKIRAAAMCVRSESRCRWHPRRSPMI
jgi:hypothetical protein